jgi:hypothetical protein
LKVWKDKGLISWVTGDQYRFKLDGIPADQAIVKRHADGSLESTVKDMVRRIYPTRPDAAIAAGIEEVWMDGDDDYYGDEDVESYSLLAVGNMSQVLTGRDGLPHKGKVWTMPQVASRSGDAVICAVISEYDDALVASLARKLASTMGNDDLHLAIKEKMEAEVNAVTRAKPSHDKAEELANPYARLSAEQRNKGVASAAPNGRPRQSSFSQGTTAPVIQQQEVQPVQVPATRSTFRPSDQIVSAEDSSGLVLLPDPAKVVVPHPAAVPVKQRVIRPAQPVAPKPAAATEKWRYSTRSRSGGDGKTTERPVFGITDDRKVVNGPTKLPSGRYSAMTRTHDALQLAEKIIMERAQVSLSFAELCALSPLVQKAAHEATRIRQGGPSATEEQEEPKQGGLEVRKDKKVAFVRNSAVESGSLPGGEEEFETEEDEDSFEVFMQSVESAFSRTLEAEDEDEWSSEEVEVLHTMNEEAAGRPQDKPAISHSWGKVADPTEQYLKVDTCNMIASVEGLEVAAMIDDGSQVNVMPQSMFEEIVRDRSRRVALRLHPKFRITGVTGKPEMMAGHAFVEVNIGGVSSHHLVWVSPSVDRFILGMPFIWKQRVDFYWSGECRVIRQNVLSGSVLQYMHVPGGPVKQMYDPVKQMRVNVVGVAPERDFLLPEESDSKEGYLSYGISGEIVEAESELDGLASEEKAEKAYRTSKPEGQYYFNQERGCQSNSSKPTCNCCPESVESERMKARGQAWIEAEKAKEAAERALNRTEREGAKKVKTELAGSQGYSNQDAEPEYGRVRPKGSPTKRAGSSYICPAKTAPLPEEETEAICYALQRCDSIVKGGGEGEIEHLSLPIIAESEVEVLAAELMSEIEALEWGQSCVYKLDYAPGAEVGKERVYEATSYGVYKPVHKKKVPVPTIYPEAEKIRMVQPEDVLGDLPEVPVTPAPRAEINGERLMQERVAELFQEECAKGF